MIQPGLQRISALLRHTSLPWPAIHVAGTNGKGSICAYLSAILDAFNQSEYRTSKMLPHVRHGRFTSPHLVDRWDCISIDNKPVEGSMFKTIEAEVLKRNHQEKIGASEFEILTATTFEIFNREQINVGVVEVGMGGAEDATNVLGQSALDEHDGKDNAGVTRREPLVSVISKIGMDHQGFLGNSLKQIAKQKAGIIKPGVPVVVDESNAPEVLEVIRSTASDMGSRIFENTPKHNQEAVDYSKGGKDRPRTSNLDRALGDAYPDGIPAHVRSNSVLALIAFVVAVSRLEGFGDFALRFMEPVRETEPLLRDLKQNLAQAVANTTFPGRQQWLNIEELTGRKGPILLDGAHNADSAHALAAKVEQLRQKSVSTNKLVTWVVSASDSKDAREIFRPLIKPGDNVVLVEFGPVDGMPWVKPMPLDQLQGAVKDVTAAAAENSTSEGDASGTRMVSCGNDVLSALKTATSMADTTEDGLFVVAGSLYLVGDVLRLTNATHR